VATRASFENHHPAKGTAPAGTEYDSLKKNLCPAFSHPSKKENLSKGINRSAGQMGK